MWLVCAFVLALALGTATANLAYGQGAGEALEKEAQAIDKMIMCPVCPAETIDQAQVEVSFQMRAVIREMLAEGRNREEILDYFVDRYGADILAAPPKSGANLLAWILPVVGVAAGLAGVFLVIRAMTGRPRPTPTATAASATPAPQPDDPELAPYLEIADRLLASRRAGATVPTAAAIPGASHGQAGTDAAGEDRRAGSDNANG